MKENMATHNEVQKLRDESQQSSGGKRIAHQESQVEDTTLLKPHQPRKGRRADEENTLVPSDASVPAQELRPEEKIFERYSVTKRRTKTSHVGAVEEPGIRSGSRLDKSLASSDSQDRGQGDEEPPAENVAPTDSAGGQSGVVRTKEERREKKRKKKSKERESQGEFEAVKTTDSLSQHPKLRSKYERSKTSKPAIEERPETLESTPADDTQQKVTLHGLGPLPQPLIAQKPDEALSYFALPPWMANPTRVTASEEKAFEDLPIESQILANLKAQNLHVALPVQGSVIPLLSPGYHDHIGDICVSAPTGSGKTLAYAVPMISALKTYAITLLRAVVVVPTRELVAQALKVCEICASGSTLKIATATGNKAMKEEKEALMERVLKYDPDGYQRTYEKEFTPADWADFDLQALVEAVNEEEHLPDYVTHYRSKVDVLICTPGRLVDHIRNTKGFTLEHVDWFIVDEADKLLNESFQEWVDVVLPALHGREPSSATGQLLAQMRMHVPLNHVQKVILSATMTEDLSQLKSLRLRNPRLVVVGDFQATNDIDMEDSHSKDESGIYHLPTTISESAIPVSDEAKKPLYLMQLLESHLPKAYLRSPFDAIEKRKASKVSNEEIDRSSSNLSETDDEATDDSESSSVSLEASEVSNPTVPLIITKQSSSNSRSALIFTRSSEAASRLSRLITLLDPRYAPVLATLTRSIGTMTSRKALTLFRQKKISILIATDRASRGLDLPDLDYVISYDVPTSVTTYVHRVGRTARARKEGKAWTLVAHREGRWFWNEIGKGKQIARNGKVERVNMDVKRLKEMEDGYSEALKKLGEEVKTKT